MEEESRRKAWRGRGKLGRRAWQQLLTALIVLALIVGLAVYANKYNQAKKDVKRLSNPQEVAKQQSRELIAKVSRLTEVPSNETPTIATVSDASKLKSQAFFTNAQNGDKVLIYTQAKRAILYRPSTDKIINIAPINIGSSTPSPQPSPPPSPRR
jgi:hypothetical protein